jgi:lipopolysaccharide export system permease protein
MRILDRYLLKEFLTPLALSLLSFSLLFVVFDLFYRMGRFVNAAVPPLSIPLYYFHYLFAFNANTSLMVAIFPISLLLAALYCASTMIRHNEFVAMMASGISFTRILMPFAAVGLGASFLAWGLQEGQADRSNRWMRNYERTVMKKEPALPAIENFLYLNAAKQRLWQIPLLNPTNTFSLGKVKVIQMRPDRSETVYITGSAYWADGTWWLRSPQIEHKNPDGALVGEPETHPKQALEMRDWDETPHDFVIEHETSAESAGGRNTSPWQYLSSGDIRTYLDNHPDFPNKKRAGIETDYYARFSTPFTCLIVALLGVPTGLKTGRANPMTRILLSFILFFLFYVCLQVSLYFGKMQWLPPMVAAWLPNVLFSALGVRMILKLN